jgi:hypothetical protein
MRTTVLRAGGRAYVRRITGYTSAMEREAIEDQGRRDQDRSRVGNLGVEETDDREFSSVEDVGDAPGENPTVDDV